MKKIRINKELLVVSLIACLILFLSVGYSSLTITGNLEDIIAKIRPSADARVTNFTLYNVSNGGISNSEEYNVENVFGSLNLPSSDSTVTYKVEVTVFLGKEMKITSINCLNENLDYELSNYTLSDPLCDSNDECNYGATAIFYLTVKNKEGYYDSTSTSHSFNFNFTYEEMQYVARIGNKRYESLQKAFDKVPTNNTETTVMLLKDTSEVLSTKANQVIRLSLQGNTISNDGTNPVFSNRGTLYINDGIITSDTSQGAINNETSGKLYVSGGRIIATGTRQGIYNNGGYAEISGNAYISAVSTQRAAVQNLNNGTMKIIGGKIVSTKFSGVDNVAKLTIGTEDGNVSETSPYIMGATNGVTTTTSMNFYDGVIMGKTASVSNKTLITDKEDGFELYENIQMVEGGTYNVLILAITNEITFDANGGTVDEASRTVQNGKPIVSLPIPTRTDYEFIGWFTDSDEGDEIKNNDIVYSDLDLYAHWIHKSQIVIAVVNNQNFNSLQAAIASVDTNNVSATITLMRDVREELTVAKNQKIILDLNGNTASNNGDKPVIVNNGNLTIINGTLTSNSTHAVINNESGSRLLISSGQIISTGTKQALYNNGGTAEITGTAYLRSTSGDRSAIHNLSSGTLTITGGTIISEGLNGIDNKAKLIIGTKDGSINTSSPIIRGLNCGVLNTSSFKFYDGTIMGVSDAISGNITEIDNNSSVMNSTEIIDGRTYQTKYLNI